MLEGLEISEILFSDLYSPLRIDAETYRPHYMEIEESVLAQPHTTLGQISKVFKKGIFDIKSSTYQDSGIPFARISNLKKMGISTNDIIYIPEKENDKNLNTYLQKGDVILSKTAYPAASIVQLENCNTSQDTVAIKLKNNCGIDSGYLVPFLNSKYGFYQMQKWFTGNIQMHLNLTDSKGIFVYQPSHEFQKLISKVFWDSFSKRDAYQTKYQEAETLLLESLHLVDFQSSQDPVNVKSFSESFGSSGRLDAEYYQIKYDDFETLVTTYSGGHEPFEIACSLKDKNFKPEDKTEYKYIELANIGKSGEITDCTIELGEELPTRARRKVATNDVVISSIEGSLSSCALVTPEYDNALCSTGFYVVNSKKLNPETLLVLFKSEPMQALLKKGCSGTILTAISKTELSKVPIPLIDKKTQEAIKTKINESFELRKQSEHLLEVAKTAVEMAIEQDEEAAFDFIKSQTS